MLPVVAKLYKENLSLPHLIIKLHSIKRHGNYKKPKVISKPSFITFHPSFKITQIINTQIKVYNLPKMFLIKIHHSIKTLAFLYGGKRVLSYFIFNIVP